MQSLVSFQRCRLGMMQIVQKKMVVPANYVVVPCCGDGVSITIEISHGGLSNIYLFEITATFGNQGIVKRRVVIPVADVSHESARCIERSGRQDGVDRKRHWRFGMNWLL